MWVRTPRFPVFPHMKQEPGNTVNDATKQRHDAAKLGCWDVGIPRRTNSIHTTCMEYIIYEAQSYAKTVLPFN